MKFSSPKRSSLQGLLALLFVILFASGAQAQGPGINSDGRDFYIGYMPGIPHSATFIQGPRELIYALIGSYTDNNTVSISYFADDGTEIQSSTIKLSKGNVAQVLLDPSHMAPQRPGEIPEYKAAHIRSKYPVTVQTLQEGSSTGGMTQGIPTSALGKSYVIASWFDNPLQDNPGYLNRDSSSSEFMIIATQDLTTITFTPNATTYGGVVGMNTGQGATGRPHPTTITLRRGQVYWVRAKSTDATEDLTGSTVFSDKPIAVLAGQERALLGDPSGVWATLDNDIRDVMVEQMIPVESWGSDYPSIPFMPPPEVPRLLQNGEGDMYRALTVDPTGGTMDMWDGNQPYSRQVSVYQAPAAQWDNIANAEDFQVRDLKPDGTRKKMSVVMYDYFQGQHDISPGSTAHHGKGGKTPQSGGGDQVLDEVTYTCPNEMNVVPIDKYRMSTVFKIPSNSHYRGFQFFNIILNKDSISKETVIINGVNKRPLSAFSPTKRYAIPNHKELIGLTYQPAPGDYLITGNTPFAAYSYGRTQTEYKDGWGYAAPCGQVYGSGNVKTKPKAVITPSCDHWDVRITDSDPGEEGIADVMLLNDPDGFVVRPARVSYNVSLEPVDFIVNPGDTVVNLTIHVNDYTKDAYAAIYVVDRSGNDTVIELRFKAQKITLSQTSYDFGKKTVGDNACTNFTLKVLATGAGDTLNVTQLTSTDPKKRNIFSVTSVPALPALLKVGDSVIYTVCYQAMDTLSHHDTLAFKFGCLDSNVTVRGQGVTPIIVASDYDFGAVAIGDTVCQDILVKNVGNGDLILDKTWIFHNTNAQFSYSDTSRLPITIPPGGKTTLHFCFHPINVGKDAARQDWGTNLRDPFLHHNKDTSQLLGFGVKPGLNWDRPDQGYTVVCDSSEVVRVNLINPAPAGSATGFGKTEHVTNVFIKGPDKAEFTIIDNKLHYTPFEGNPFDLNVGDSIWVDLKFTPDISKPYALRRDTLVAVGTSGSPEIILTGTVRHAVLSIVPATYDFGIQLPGTIFTQTFMLHNTGDTDAVIQNFPGLTGDYKIVSGPNVGDHLKAGDSVAIVVQWTAPADGPSVSADSITSMTPDCTNRPGLRTPWHGY